MGDQVNISVVFKSAPWTSPTMSVFFLLQTLIGNATPFSSGGPGKGMYARAYTHLMQAHGFVNQV
jgi:processing peptidase subunit alpha